MLRCSPPLCLALVLVTGCFSDNEVGSLDTDSGSSTTDPVSESTSVPDTASASGTTTSASGTATSSGTTATTDGSTDDSTGESTGQTIACEGGNCAVDILVVMDNSGTMAREQARIGGAMAGLEAGLRARQLDVQIMFTTVDNGNPFCTPFEPKGYDPSMGSPITTSCTNRLDDFTGLGLNPEVVPEACTNTCPVAAAPVGDPFVAFSEDGDNAPDVPPTDIDGDDVDDSPVAMTMACLAPQGINGCGYESPLETMLQALNPSATWNQGARPFLRPEATLAVVVVTDEADCSLEDFGAMNDESYYEIDPDSGMPMASSALCWNAGVECIGPDGEGEYDCAPANGGPLYPLGRYTGLLINELRDTQGKDVVMLGVVGVPSVTERADDSPFEAQAGGVADLVYRDWLPSDIQPSDDAMGITAEDKQFDFGIGPGCSQVGGEEAQAVPPSRLRAVCESLNEGSERTDLRCCLESICDEDFSGATQCLLGLLDNVHAG
jgi:hypothetical protein